MRSNPFGGIAIACATTAMLATATGPENSAHAGGQCKRFTRNGSNFELCVEGKKGVFTDVGTLNTIQFVLNKCVPNSSSYVSKHSDIHGIALADYRYVVWAYCNKGWGGL